MAAAEEFLAEFVPLAEKAGRVAAVERQTEQAEAVLHETKLRAAEMSLEIQAATVRHHDVRELLKPRQGQTPEEHVVAMQDGKLSYDGAAEEYLSQRALSVIEISLDAGAEAAWLGEQGFRQGTKGDAGRWLRTVSRADKMQALARLTERLGDRLRDLNVRELETIDVPQNQSSGGAENGRSATS